ncbi:hypothetical protein K1T71_012889 [Dendrolimus kikuchii]|uniref:Uncharacterized protein n=1 Tax=Dendrolimus kikuchii TaxID=765133 RepID=A0ACC1CIQ5_9NEOP|nr:hypothetical protein K1T71_012889 [Dendrolimus kikuchii]
MVSKLLDFLKNSQIYKTSKNLTEHFDSRYTYTVYTLDFFFSVATIMRFEAVPNCGSHRKCREPKPLYMKYLKLYKRNIKEQNNIGTVTLSF